MSPEVLRGGGYSWKSDVWSLGCMLYELAMLRNPFKSEGLNLYSLFQKINKVGADGARRCFRPRHGLLSLSPCVGGTRCLIRQIRQMSQMGQMRHMGQMRQMSQMGQMRQTAGHENGRSVRFCAPHFVVYYDTVHFRS